jgi:hypothetical protein
MLAALQGVLESREPVQSWEEARERVLAVNSDPGCLDLGENVYGWHRESDWQMLFAPGLMHANAGEDPDPLPGGMIAAWELRPTPFSYEVMVHLADAGVYAEVSDRRFSSLWCWGAFPQSNDWRVRIHRWGGFPDRVGLACLRIFSICRDFPVPAKARAGWPHVPATFRIGESPMKTLDSLNVPRELWYAPTRTPSVLRSAPRPQS